MDKIWDRNPSKSYVIGRCGGDENTEWPRRTDTSRTLNNKTKIYLKRLSNCLIEHYDNAILVLRPNGSQ